MRIAKALIPVLFFVSCSKSEKNNEKLESGLNLVCKDTNNAKTYDDCSLNAVFANTKVFGTNIKFSESDTEISSVSLIRVQQFFDKNSDIFNELSESFSKNKILNDYINESNINLQLFFELLKESESTPVLDKAQIKTIKNMFKDAEEVVHALIENIKIKIPNNIDKWAIGANLTLDQNVLNKNSQLEISSREVTSKILPILEAYKNENKGSSDEKVTRIITFFDSLKSTIVNINAMSNEINNKDLNKSIDLLSIIKDNNLFSKANIVAITSYPFKIEKDDKGVITLFANEQDNVTSSYKFKKLKSLKPKYDPKNDVRIYDIEKLLDSDSDSGSDAGSDAGDLADFD